MGAGYMQHEDEYKLLMKQIQFNSRHDKNKLNL